MTTPAHKPIGPAVPTLVVDARHGPDYEAAARLYGDDGQPVGDEDWAVLRERPGFACVESGSYTPYRVIESFPAAPHVAAEYGECGVVFIGGPGARTLLVHAGDRLRDGRTRPTTGAIRISISMIRRILEVIGPQRGHLDRCDGSRLRLEVRIGEPEPKWKFWAQPTADERVGVCDDDSFDLFDVLCPELVPFRHRNPGLAWMLFFEDQAYRDEVRRSEESALASGEEGDFGGSGASGTWRDTVPSDLAGNDAAPLFAVSQLVGTDSFGRVVHAQAGTVGSDTVGAPAVQSLPLDVAGATPSSWSSELTASPAARSDTSY